MFVSCPQSTPGNYRTFGYQKNPVIEKMTVVERESRKAYRKVKESIYIKLTGAFLNRIDGHDLPDLYFLLLWKEAQGA